MATYDPEQILSIAREIQDLMTEKAFEERARIGQQDDGISGPPENTYKEPSGSPSQEQIEENDRNGSVPPITPGEWKEVHDGYAYIPKEFEKRIGPDPSGMAGSIETMGKAGKPFSDGGQGTGVYQDVSWLEKATDNFHGSAARSFQLYVVSPLDSQGDSVVKNNQELIAALEAQYKSCKELFQKSFDDLLELAEKAKQSASDLPGGGGGEVNWGMANAIATVAAGLAVGSAGVAGFFTVLAGLAAKEGAEGEPPASLEAVSVGHLAGKLNEGFQKFDLDRNEASSRLKARLNKINGAIEKYRSDGLTLDEPADLPNYKPSDGGDYTDSFKPPSYK